ncbi:hypothetical protein [Burkholderia gladioli]|uniref:hypothetical protein n=1 Tax=Burkholderia gladioli TaxID=28095 RepID=UPI0016408B85|nr:hypothetical protein [Burkholderia gladioli]
MHKQYQVMIGAASVLIQKSNFAFVVAVFTHHSGQTMLKRCMPIPALLLVLAGCATTDDLRSREPIASGETNLSVSDFLGCVQERWINNGADRVNSIPTSGRSSLTSAGQTGIELLLDVTPSATGSTFRLYSRMAFGDSRFITATRSCG